MIKKLIDTHFTPTYDSAVTRKKRRIILEPHAVLEPGTPTHTAYVKQVIEALCAPEDQLVERDVEDSPIGRWLKARQKPKE